MRTIIWHLMRSYGLILIVCLFCIINCDLCVAGPIYVYTEDDGTIRFTSKPPADGREAKVFTSSGQNFSSYSSWGPPKSEGKLFLTAFEDSINQAARRHRVHPALIRAVIHVESGFQPTAVSPKGAKGLMQLMPSTAKIMGVTNILSPYQNIDGGTRWLANMYKKFKGNLKYALAAYNAGPGAVEQHRGIPPYEETRRYVTKVLRLNQEYLVALRKLAQKRSRT